MEQGQVDQRVGDPPLLKPDDAERARAHAVQRLAAEWRALHDAGWKFFLEKLAERNVLLDTSWFAPPPGSEPW